MEDDPGNAGFELFTGQLDDVPAASCTDKGQLDEATPQLQLAIPLPRLGIRLGERGSPNRR